MVRSPVVSGPWSCSLVVRGHFRTVPVTSESLLVGEGMGCDLDGYIRLRIRIHYPHNSPLAFHPDCVARGRPLQNQGQPDGLPWGKPLLCLEGHTREAHVPRDATPAIQFHGDSEREANGPASFSELWLALGVHTFTVAPPHDFDNSSKDIFLYIVRYISSCPKKWQLAHGS